MANAYYQEEIHWKSASRMNLSFSKDIKSHWDSNYIDPLIIIESKVNEDLNSALPISSSDIIVIKSKALVNFIHKIKKGDHIKIEDGILYVPYAIRELIAHHLGNDIQKIIFILSDSLDNGDSSLTPEGRKKIKQAIIEMKEFNQRLFQIIRV